MHAEVELQSELDWTATLGGDMNRFSLLLLDLHPVDLLRHVPEIIHRASFLALPLSMFTPSSASSSSFVSLGFLLQIYARDDFQVNARCWDWTVVHEQNTGQFWSN